MSCPSREQPVCHPPPPLRAQGLDGWCGVGATPAPVLLSAVLLALAALTLLLVAGGTAVAIRGTGSLPWLARAPRPSGRRPLVSVIVAARDEAAGVVAGMTSLLAQSYRPLEVVAVDDRSSDCTAELLDGLAAGDGRLRVLRVRKLPPGWLGKNHALHRGAAAATGELLLFTDADVVLHPDAVARAVGLLQARELDHLTVFPELQAHTPLLNLFVGTFAALFAQFFRPWRASMPEAREAVGVGAFNLVRAEGYHHVGGHQPIALRPDDDMMLARLLKRSGLRQAVALGRGLVSVHWYPTLPAAIRGLEKNAFAGFDYSLGKAGAGVLLLLLFNVWPFVALLLLSGWPLLLNGAVALLLVVNYAASTRVSGANRWYAPAYPFGALLIAFAIVRSVAIAVRRGGIRWRGTFYSLDELRANRL